jgi:ribosomal-protein-alanine N-acetyltransferase
VSAVRIRPVEPGDAETLARLYAQAREFLAPFDPPRSEGFATVAGQRRELERLHELRRQGRHERFLIEAGGEAVGSLGVSNIVRGPFQSASIGYWVAQAWNGRGIASEAVRLVTEWAFCEALLHRLEAATLLENVASQRVLEKNRFRRIGISPRYLHIGGAWRDHLLFARTAED